MIHIDKNGVITVRKMTEEERAKERERMRSRARHNEASALRHARNEERAKWQRIIEEQEKALMEQDKIFLEQAALIENLRSKLDAKK